MKEVADWLEEEYPILYEGLRIRVNIGTYATNNATSITLSYWDEELGMEAPYAVATVNVEHADLAEDEVVIKDYSENEGILPLLIKAGIIAKPHDKVTLGYATGQICQLIN